MKFIATCKLGLEALVTRQLRDLDIEVLETADARVSFSGGAEAMVKSLLWLRTAERVRHYVSSTEQVTLPNEEVAYLALHIQRLTESTQTGE